MSISGDCTLRLENEGREIRAVCSSFQGWFPSWYNMGDYCKLKMSQRKYGCWHGIPRSIRFEMMCWCWREKKKALVLAVAVVKTGSSGGRDPHLLGRHHWSAAVVAEPLPCALCSVPCAVWSRSWTVDMDGRQGRAKEDLNLLPFPLRHGIGLKHCTIRNLAPVHSSP